MKTSTFNTHLLVVLSLTLIVYGIGDSFEIAFRCFLIFSGLAIPSGLIWDATAPNGGAK
jgi:hypothetical protein